jgi:acetoin utilization protein AcuB
MYIGRIMHTNLITVSPETSLADAQKLVDQHSIDHLLVIDNSKKLIGILSDRDLKQYWASPATSLSTHELNYLLEKVTVDMIMIRTVVIVSTATTIERAAFIMQQYRISALPVMEDDDLVGIITSIDVMAVLFEAIGISDESVRLGVFVSDSIGQLAKVTTVLKEAGINIQSLLCWPEKEFPGITQMVFRVGAPDSDNAIRTLNENGIKVKLQYEKDITPFLPENKEER